MGRNYSGHRNMKSRHISFENDQVEGWTPVQFSITFTRKLRSVKSISQPPSIRTTLAIPQFLTARYCRTRLLTPGDYIQAAVLNTPYEDQTIAEKIARDILFPQKKKELPKIPDKTKKKTKPAPENITSLILEDLASLNVDIDNMDDLSGIDDLIGSSQDEAMQAFELFETLYSSSLESERSLADLCSLFGGPAELSASGIGDLHTLRPYLQELLRSEIGDLTPNHIFHACRSGFSNMLQQEVKHPWELAGVLAGANNNQALKDHLDDIQEKATCRELGKTLQFLKPYQSNDIHNFVDQLKNKPKNLADFAEIVNGMDEWFDPSQDLINQSIKENLYGSMSAANWMDHNFDVNMSEKVFDTWAHTLQKTPDLEQLADVAVNCKSWIDLANKAYTSYIKTMRKQIQKELASKSDHSIGQQIKKNIEMASKLQKNDIYTSKRIASNLSTETMVFVDQKDQFLAILDEFLDHKIMPSKIEKIVQAGKALGVNPDEIYDRLGDHVEQLKQMILNHTTDAVDRYKMLIQKISHIEQDLCKDLTHQALTDKNYEAMASLLAIDLCQASSLSPEDFVIDSLCYKGIGDGMNLLKQWFNSRHTLNNKLKEHVKALAREALIELAFDWINKGSGSCNSGLIPQNQARPFLSGDDLDLLDIESTLDIIISSGKNLNAVTDEDLYVYDTSKGRAALGILIDISGSMSGDELAICSIAVVMLLGKLRSEEIAIALFESDTHIMKSFKNLTDLDSVIDKLLDLKAMGGTRVDAALKWIYEEFETVTDTEYRILFLLSDFCFFEKHEEVSVHCQTLGDCGVKFIGASHGRSCMDYVHLFHDCMGGQSIQLKSIHTLPSILIEALEQIGEGDY